MNKTRRAFLRSAMCVPALALAACGDDNVPLPLRYQGAVQKVIDQYHIPGAVASVRVPGAAEWKQAFGRSDIASGAPMDLANHFSIRSVTKSYTVTVVLQLVREAAISLDDTLDRYVPGLPNGSLISIADLAGMQSGLADYATAPMFLADFQADVTRPFTPQDLVAYAVPLSPRFAPGARYEYSNTNTVLLGNIVEAVTHQPMAQALAWRILTPLGLASTSYPGAVPLPVPHPTPYSVPIAGGNPQVQPYINPTALGAAGAMESTLDDMQSWGAALGDGRLIGAELQLARINRSREVTGGPQYDRYGLGLGILRGWLGHTGDGIGFQAATFYDPVTLATIAVLVNATPSGGPADLNFAQEIFESLADVVSAH